MYAVIKTGGKQYRVQPGDMLVVEKLAGEAGDAVAFDQVLMLGGFGEGGVEFGAPVIEGAVVRATLVETRKGDKVKILKKIRRQGYRRTRGHRQTESVLRVTSLEGAGQSAAWEGEVALTTRAEMNARARGLAPRKIETADDEVAPAAALVEAEAAGDAAAKKPRAPRRPKPADQAPSEASMDAEATEALDENTSVLGIDDEA